MLNTTTGTNSLVKYIATRLIKTINEIIKKLYLLSESIFYFYPFLFVSKSSLIITLLIYKFLFIIQFFLGNTYTTTKVNTQPTTKID